MDHGLVRGLVFGGIFGDYLGYWGRFYVGSCTGVCGCFFGCSCAGVGSCFFLLDRMVPLDREKEIWKIWIKKITCSYAGSELFRSGIPRRIQHKSS